MKLLIEVFLPNTTAARALAKRVRVIAGIYDSSEFRKAALAEKVRDARAELAGRGVRKKNFLQPDAQPNRRLIAYDKAELLELVNLLGPHLIDPDKHGKNGEVGKSCGGD